jgi:hypothetical protein
VTSQVSFCFLRFALAVIVALTKKILLFSRGNSKGGVSSILQLAAKTPGLKP